MSEPEAGSAPRRSPSRERSRGGLVTTFARHPTAGNLFMTVLILAGIFALLQLNRQFFPDFGIDVVRINVVWPGATAEDVEASIVEAIEPEVRFLDEVKRVTSVAAEGSAGVYVEFEPETDMRRAVADVEQAVQQVTTLPEDSERPVIKQIVRYDTISRLVLSGPFDERTLKREAKRIRDELLDRGIDRVVLFGARSEEIRALVESEALRRLDLTFDEVAAAIGESSRDVPAGDLGGPFERQPRALGLARTGAEVGEIEVRATPSGHRLEVADLARIEDGFDQDEPTGLRGGQPAIELEIQRSLTSDALEVAAEVDRYVEQLPPTLPPGMQVEQYDVVADLIRERIDLLVRNGLGGLVLVLCVLFLFLNARVAFWIALGIPVSLLAMLGVLWLAGMSINMISLFGMLLAIGIVVDDAIVVGEHAVALHERGLDPQAAAEQGVLRMLAPVTSASLTTIASFLPILVVGGVIGQVIREIPLVVIAVLIASLLECFLVLPCHMRGALGGLGPPGRFRRTFDAGFDRFRHGWFKRTVARAVTWRYATLAGAFAALILAIGVIAGGRVGFVFFAAPESEVVYVNVVMAPGSSREATAATFQALDDALVRTEEAFGYAPGDLALMSFARIGENVGRDRQVSQLEGDNVGGMIIELLAADKRDVRTDAFIEAWRANLPPLPGVESLATQPRMGGPPGREVDIRLRGGRSLADVKQAALEVQDLLRRIPGVSEIEDDLPYGKQEILIELTPRGRALGFTTEQVGRQLRDAFQGRIAKRFARGDEEVEVIVQLAEADRRTLTLRAFSLRSPEGFEVPLGDVATLREDRGFQRIMRENGARRVAITAELDEAVIQLDQLTAALMREGLPEIASRYGLDYRFAGKAEEQEETLADLKLGTGIALALIYIILAWVFASFTRPAAVMLVIPFGLVGAVLGHLVMGYDISILSLISLLGLSGILVNDSIILVTAIDRRVAEGAAWFEAVVEGTVSRFRAVLLTSATTIGGLTFLMFETSQSAQFLIPMAITIVFGLMVTTFLVLFVVPSMIAVQHDLGRLARRLTRRTELAEEGRG